MNDKTNELEAFEKKIKDVMHTDSIDPETRERLDRARALAIKAIPPAEVPAARSRVRPYAMAATAAVAGLIVFALLSPSSEDTLPTTASSDMDLLLAEDDLDMLADVEFFQWLSVVSDEG